MSPLARYGFIHSCFGLDVQRKREAREISHREGVTVIAGGAMRRASLANPAGSGLGGGFSLRSMGVFRVLWLAAEGG